MKDRVISKVLLLDASFAAKPIHDYLVSAGFDVWTVGNRNSDPLAIAYPEKWIHADYSNVQTIKELIASSRFDAVIPGCTDVSMATYVRLGIEGPYRYSVDADDILNKKHLFRRLCAELELPAPLLIEFEQLPKQGRFICKPVDSFSGRGVTVFNAEDRNAAIAAFTAAKSASPSGKVICEEFVEGQLYSYSAFVEAGEVARAFVVREGSRYDSFAVDTSYLLDWSAHAQAEILKRCVERMAAHLSLGDGLVHVQFIMNEIKLAILEVTRRCPGDLYSKLIEYSTGFPYAAKYASYFVAGDVEEWQISRKYIVRHTIKQPGGSHFSGVEMDIPCVSARVLPLKRLGEVIDGSGFQRTALVFAEQANEDAQIEVYESLVNRNPSSLQSL